jgi:hypothetical protein
MGTDTIALEIVTVVVAYAALDRKVRAQVTTSDGNTFKVKAGAGSLLNPSSGFSRSSRRVPDQPT